MVQQYYEFDLIKEKDKDRTDMYHAGSYSSSLFWTNDITGHNCSNTKYWNRKGWKYQFPFSLIQQAFSAVSTKKWSQGHMGYGIIC
jgi:hypothetical protein